MSRHLPDPNKQTNKQTFLLFFLFYYQEKASKILLEKKELSAFIINLGILFRIEAKNSNKVYGFFIIDFIDIRILELKFFSKLIYI